MITAAPARTERRAGPLTDKGLTAVSLFKLRECWDDLSACERRQLTVELDLLARRYAPRRPSPAA
jgi:hypothetical protein